MNKIYDVAIVGGGIMGLLAAYEISKSKKSVLIIDNRKIGSPEAASSGLTRSLRNDYKTPQYSALARKAWDKWCKLENELQTKLVVKTGCLNIATDTIKADAYAREAVKWLQRDGNENYEFVGKEAVNSAYPQLSNIDYASLDIEAGIGLASKALSRVREALGSMEYVDIQEECVIERINGGAPIGLLTNKGLFRASKLVIAAGLGSTKVLEKIEDSIFRLKLYPDRPVECLYYQPNNPEAYMSDRLPVFANLDVGIYGHPIVEGVSLGVKIGMYAPPNIVSSEAPTTISGVQEFVNRYLPELARTSKVTRVTNTDLCSYDMTEDDNFVIGLVPGQENIVIATGFCGTGYKFSTVIAEIVCNLVTEGKTKYEISAFDPSRLTNEL